MADQRMIGSAGHRKGGYLDGYYFHHGTLYGTIERLKLVPPRLYEQKAI